MNANELLAYAESEINRLGLGDSPTNCHGVVARIDGGGVSIGDGTVPDTFCLTRDDIDEELKEYREWYDESK